MITNKTFRELAIKLLNDENGINSDAYRTLEDIAFISPHNNNDIFNAVSAQDNRYFLNEDLAEKLLKENV